MDKRHIIEDAEFDISFDTVTAAREHEPGLAAFIRERLLPLADEIFCELANDGMVARIDRLEIDLGAIRCSGFHDEMESRFREKLRSLLLDKMRSLATAHSPAEGLVGRQQAERGQLETFLETGRMPWHAERATEGVADAMLEQTLAHQGEAFAGFLKRTPHRDSVVKRLARQFPDRLLVDVMQLLAPAHATLTGELIAKLGETWKKKSAGITEKELKSLVWERLLGEHLKAGVSDPERLLRDIVKELFVRHARPGDISGKSVSSPERDPARSADDFMYAPHDAADRRGETPLAARQPEDRREWGADTARLRALLETAFATGDAGALSGQWEALRDTHRELVRAVFMQRMGDDRLQQKLADGFPETMLAELLNLLSPQDGGFMVALSGLPELRGAGSAKNPEFWHYTLGCLHGSPTVDRAAYTRGLLRHMSAQGVEQRQLAQAIAAIAPELKDALADLPEATGAADLAEEAVRAGELYRQLVSRLNGASGGEPQFIAMLKELESAYPETHAHLLRQLQNGEIRTDIGVLAMGEARQLVISLIRLNPESQDLLRALGSQEHLVQDTEGYYRHILDKLVRSQAVDLEAAAADEGGREGMQAAAKAEAALGRSLSERQEVRASVREEIARTIEAERADELYHRLVLRLGGTHDGQDMVPAIKRLASTYPETLARLQRRLQAGELRADVGTLDGREARQLVTSLIRLNSGSKESDFLRAIERYAGRAKSEAGYFRHILESLIRNRTIDLEEAVRSHETAAHRERPHAAREDADGGDRFVIRHDDLETAGAEPALESAGLLRIRLEEALALGHAERVAGVWGELLSGHADMLRQVFMRRLGDEAMRTRLANGFPESMLQELVRALSPSAGRDIEMLAKMLAAQPGLRASGTQDAKNIPFWEYTLSYLHACGPFGYERSGYAQGLVHHLAEQGVSQATLQQAIARIAPAWDERGDPSFHHGQADDRQEAEDAYAGTVRDGEPIRQLLRRLTGGSGSRELAQEIAELADGKPEAVREFYRQLQSGEAALDVAVLTAREARLLIAAFIAANHGSMGEDIRREIEAHAGKARDERRYYQSVLEMLVRNRVLDIEEAMAALPAETAGEGIPPVQVGTEEKTASGSLRARFESALMQGDAGGIAGVWNDLRFNYGNLVRDVFNLSMGDEILRRQLAERFPEAMLFELISVLAPLAGGFIESLERQLGLQAGAAKSEAVRRVAREHALFYLHAFGARGFRRADYARDLMQRMAAQGMDGSVFMRAAAAADPALAKSLPGPDSMDIEAVAIDMRRAPADRLRALLETAFATGDAGALSGQWEALRDTHRELVRAVFMQRMGDDRLQQKVAGGFPETMLLELLNLLSPQDGGFMLALSGLPELRGAGSAKNIEFWHYTLGCLHGSPTVDRAAYARGLLRHMSAQGVVQRQLAQALAGIAPELKEAFADQPEASATSDAELAKETIRADELYRQLVQRLNGASGGEPQFIAMLKELESAYPETQAHLLRQLQSGEIRTDVGALAMGEARQLVISLIRLNPESQDLLRAIGSQEHLVQDTEGYYRHILDKLVRSQVVNLEAAVAEAAQGNEAMLQKARPAHGDDTFHDEETVQAQDAALPTDEAAIPARADYLRTLLDSALLTGDAGELAGVWDELRQHHPAIVRERFERLMGDAGAQGRTAQGFPAGMLAELVSILAPTEDRFIGTLAAQLQAGLAAGGKHRFLWQHTLGYLHANHTLDRLDYAESLSRYLSERGVDRRDILQAVTLADAALGKILSERQDMHAGTQEEIARAATIETSTIETSTIETSAIETSAIETSAIETSAAETERAGELYRRVTQRLSGMSGGEPEFAALVEEMASACPEMLARLLRQVQSGELRADVGALGAREARQLVTSLIRQNSGVKESDFLRAIERYAGRAKSEAEYYRHVLESLIRNRNIDLEEAADAVPQERGRHMPADAGGDRIETGQGAASGDEQRPQMAEDIRPLATTGDNAMQVENTSIFDGHGAMDDSESTEEIYIANAGMVLATPYLPQLFRMLDLTEGTKFRDERSAERAIHLLQFMVNESCDSPEFLLSLNKLLCGVPTGVPIVREIELLQREKEAIEGMLNGIIRNWTILGNTSVQGLRESFLQRSGRLQLKEDNWHLKVESKGIDVLLDRLPWSFALIKHPWMRRPIYVEWR